MLYEIESSSEPKFIVSPPSFAPKQQLSFKRSLESIRSASIPITIEEEEDHDYEHASFLSSLRKSFSEHTSFLNILKKKKNEKQQQQGQKRLSRSSSNTF